MGKSPSEVHGTMKFILVLLLSVCLVVAACDATAPDTSPPGPATRVPSSSNTGKTDQPAAGPSRWAFPPEIEKSRVVFTTFDTQALRWNVHKINVDSTGLHAFDFPRDNPGGFPDIVFHAFRWSPDGRRLVYRGSNTNTDNWYLVLVDSSGTSRQLLTQIGSFMDDPSWNPKGDRILYGRGGFFGGQLGVIFQTTIVDTLGISTDFFIDPQSRFFEGDSVFYALFDDGQNALYDAEWAPDGEHLYLTGLIGKRRSDGGRTANDVEIFNRQIDPLQPIPDCIHVLGNVGIDGRDHGRDLRQAGRGHGRDHGPSGTDVPSATGLALIHSSISSLRHATRCGPILRLFGNSPACSRRQIVVREYPVAASTSGSLSILSTKKTPLVRFAWTGGAYIYTRPVPKRNRSNEVLTLNGQPTRTGLIPTSLMHPPGCVDFG